MIIQDGCVRAKLVSGGEMSRDWLRRYLTFPDAKAARHGGPAEATMLAIDGSFPAGFVPMIVKAGQEDLMPVHVHDARPEAGWLDPDVSWLRDYQLAAYRRLRDADRGVVKHPTGSGKTFLTAAVAASVDGPTLYFAEQSSLVEQTCEVAEGLSRQHGLGLRVDGLSNVKPDGGPALHCATTDSIGALLKRQPMQARALLARFRAVVVDECHQAAASTPRRILEATHGARVRVGMSATPLARGDRRSVLVVGALGPVVHAVKTERLVREGHVSGGFVRLVKHRQQVLPGTWNEVETEAIATSASRNELLVRIVCARPKPAFVFVRREAHGRILEKMLINAGVPTAFLFGKHSQEWRRSGLARLRSGHLEVVVASDIFQAGLSVHELRTLVNAAGQQSVIATLQRMGRGTRTTDEKTSFEQWDVLDEGNGWLEKHARRRLSAYREEGQEVLTFDSVEEALAAVA